MRWVAMNIRDSQAAAAALTTSTAPPWTEPLSQKVMYVQVKVGQSGPWSTSSEKWTTADQCNSAFYLNDTSINPSNWRCNACPEGASCEAESPWSGVAARFGYYRIPSDTIPTTFERCLFAGACLGAPNLEFVNTYFDPEDKTTDLSQLTNYSEGCNVKYGFNASSRLCHTCHQEYSRVGLHECKGCPKDAVINYFLIGLGVVVIGVGFVVLVKMTIDDAGKTKLSESIQKCILNYFQVAALFTGIPLRWPKAMRDFFEFQGAVSTIGEHLVNPDCTSNLSAADLFYAKQLAYLVVPVAMIVVVYLIWKAYATITQNEWSRPASAKTTTTTTPENTGSSRTYVNVKDKYVVTVCVLVYLFYPTLCKQAFALFTCFKVNDKMYLLADLEEECSVGRHLLYVWLVGIPQLIVFVVGLPLAGLYFLFRNHRRLDTIPVRARYGLFLGGYRNDRYYWELFLVIRKVSVIAVSSFGVAMSPEMQSLLLLMVLMLCCGLQHWGQPFQITGIDHVRHRILPNLELSVLAMLMLTLWAGLVMFKLNESSDSETVYVLLTVVTVLANVVFVLVLIFVLARQMIQEQREEESWFVLKMDQVFGCGNDEGNDAPVAASNSTATKNDSGIEMLPVGNNNSSTSDTVNVRESTTVINPFQETGEGEVTLGVNPMHAARNEAPATSPATAPATTPETDTPNAARARWNILKHATRTSGTFRKSGKERMKRLSKVMKARQNESVGGGDTSLDGELETVLDVKAAASMHVDEKTGRRYSYNEATGHTQWLSDNDDGSEEAPQENVGESKQQTKILFREFVDNDDAVYYEIVETGEVVWDMPVNGCQQYLNEDNVPYYMSPDGTVTWEKPGTEGQQTTPELNVNPMTHGGDGGGGGGGGGGASPTSST